MKYLSCVPMISNRRFETLPCLSPVASYLESEHLRVGSNWLLMVSISPPDTRDVLIGSRLRPLS